MALRTSPADMVMLMAIAIITSAPLSALSDEAPTTTQSDPPGRVARLNYFSGSVTMEPAGIKDWSYVQLNRPLTTGDQLWADNGARAELHIGSAALHLDQNTALDIVDLNDATTQLKVTQGTFAAHIRALPPDQHVEIDTPNIALQITSSGSFRVDVAPDGSTTTVTLRSGTALLYGDDGSFGMSAGQQIRFAGTDLQQQAGGAAPAPDAFDNWVANRDRAEDNSISARYVSREIPGYEDLDTHGTWRDDATYGEIWVPAVAVSAGWAPYREGHWAWIAPWGWTWIDDAPWGFAPFHYGRWVYVGEVWAWVPGPIVVARPPVYAPALVAFMGNGGGGVRWSLSISIGAAVGPGCAWIPLGPGEVWRPAYAYSPGYYRRVNNVSVTNINSTTIVNNITNVNNTYINQNVPGAVTAVPATAFVQGQSVAKTARPLTAQQIAHAQIGAGAPPIAPVRESFSAGLRPATVRQPATLAQRAVVATQAPVMPAAYRDTLAQRFATQGGSIPGAGEPVVRVAAPAEFATTGKRAGPGPSANPQGFHVIKIAEAHPVGSSEKRLYGHEAAQEPNRPRVADHRYGDAKTRDAAPSLTRIPDRNDVPHPTGALARRQEGTGDVRPGNGGAYVAHIPEGPHMPAERQHLVTPQPSNHEPHQHQATSNHVALPTDRIRAGGYEPNQESARESANAQRREPQLSASQHPLPRGTPSEPKSHPQVHRKSDDDHHGER